MTTANDAIEILTRDHHLVKDLFRDFAGLDGLAPLAARLELVLDICTRLTVHTTVEEELFYPAVRDAINDDKLMNEAEVEHDAARYIIEQLLPMADNDTYLHAKVNVLREYTTHHINVEEGEMFPKIRKTRLDLSTLGRQLMDRKTALQEQLATREQLAAFMSSRA